MPKGIYKRGKRYSYNKEIKNPGWKGENAGYACMHDWIRRWKGKPSCCEVCGTKSAKKYVWANIDHTYKRVLDDYIRMCVSCHIRYDIKNNGYNNWSKRKRGKDGRFN